MKKEREKLYMIKNVCFVCDRKFVFEKWYGKCEHCKILRPESKERMLEEMNTMLALRTKLEKHLYDLEQKQISFPNEMTEQEKEECTAWTEHNNLYNEIIVFFSSYDVKEIRICEIYPRLYLYVKISDKIKAMY